MPSPLHEPVFRTRRVVRARVSVPALRGLVAFFVALLQLVSVLHFTLVPHTFSAALGGVVHIHGTPQQAAEPERRLHAPALSASTPSCVVDVCPYADAASGSVPCEPPALTGAITFGEARLLAKAEARSASSRRVFLSAPKTSPPV